MLFGRRGKAVLRGSCHVLHSQQEHHRGSQNGRTPGTRGATAAWKEGGPEFDGERGQGSRFLLPVVLGQSEVGEDRPDLGRIRR